MKKQHQCQQNHQHLKTRSDRKKASWVDLLRQEMGKVVIGQKYLVDRLILGLLANGHVLLEGVLVLLRPLPLKHYPNVFEHSLKNQFTPDLLPADVIGTLIYSPNQGEFSTKKGRFSRIYFLLMDKSGTRQSASALLEGMQERQVTIGEKTFPLPRPFLVLATENPIDQEGTYPLPEAQMDRFMLKLIVDYPNKEEELKILESNANVTVHNEVSPVVDAETIFNSRNLVDQIYLDDKLKGYLVDVVQATRTPEKFGASEMSAFIRFGSSPRATISLALASKAHAFMQGRSFVTPQDVKDIGFDVLRHRIIASYEAEAEDITTDDIIKTIFETVPVP